MRKTFKKMVKKIPYTQRIALVIVIFSLLPCALLGSVYLNNSISEWKKDILKDYQNDTDSTAMLMSKTITEFQSKIQYLLNNYEMRSYLARIEDLTIPEALDMITVTNEAVAAITAGNSDMVVRWYPHKSILSYGNYAYTMERFTEEFEKGVLDPGYQEILALKDGDLLWKVRSIARGDNNRGTPLEMLCLYSQITDMRGANCVLEFSIPVASLANHSKDFTPTSGSMFAICLHQPDKMVNIILSSTLNTATTEELLQQYHDSQKIPGYEIIRSEISNTNDSEVIFLIPEAYVLTYIGPKLLVFIGISLLIVFVILGTCYLTSYLLTHKIINAVNTLTTDLNHILTEPAHADHRRSDDEIGRIVLQVRKLIHDTQEYCLKIERYETEALRMELELLQMRFNPHLLYNTLDAINHQVRSPIARSTIDSLCGYYRIVLNNGYLIIRIEDEINMIKKYLSIVKFTYGLDDITYEFGVEEQVKQYTIVKHVLQPIVENALNHGIRPSGRGGILRISAREIENDIVIRVTDNGVGMTPEKTKSLLEAPSASAYGGGYGIYNVQQRIQVYYGKKYGLQIDSSPDGTTVTMHIPKISSEESKGL